MGRTLSANRFNERTLERKIEMPYVKQKTRNLYDVELNDLIEKLRPDEPGDLNYIITRLIQAFVGPEATYDQYNAAVGVLECAKMELYRRAVTVYEDHKIIDNGDVY